MAHEPAEPVVPVVVARNRVDRSRVVAVRTEELVDVLVDVADRIGDVTHHDEEARVLPGLEQDGEDCVLRMGAFTGVTGDQAGEVFAEVAAVDGEVAADAACALGGDPALAIVVGRIAEQPGQRVVAGRPQNRRPHPGELRRRPRRLELAERRWFAAAPAGAALARA